MDDRVSVIIPFYQEDAGILRRAVTSVVRQAGVENVTVIVVDDGSQVAAVDDLRGVSIPAHVSLRVLEQANGGPAAARNRALDSLADSTDYVAFLDSDDEWMSDHLYRAVKTLEKGYDFYFSDYLVFEEKKSVFERRGVIDVKSHTDILGLNNVYEYKGDFFVDQIKYSLCYTSTVVYRRHKFPEIRFQEMFQYACEDKFCWAEMAATNPRVAFSMKSESRVGRGANIFQGTTWGTGTALRISQCEVLYEKQLARKLRSDAYLRRLNKARLSQARREFSSNFLHILRRGNNIKYFPIIKYYVADPKSIIVLFIVALGVIFDKILRVQD